MKEEKASGHYNHISPHDEKSYGHMSKSGGDHHLTNDHERGSAPGRHGHESKEM